MRTCVCVCVLNERREPRVQITNSRDSPSDAHVRWSISFIQKISSHPQWDLLMYGPERISPRPKEDVPSTKFLKLEENFVSCLQCSLQVSLVASFVRVKKLQQNFLGSYKIMAEITVY